MISSCGVRVIVKTVIGDSQASHQPKTYLAHAGSTRYWKANWMSKSLKGILILNKCSLDWMSKSLFQCLLHGQNYMFEVRSDKLILGRLGRPENIFCTQFKASSWQMIQRMMKIHLVMILRRIILGMPSNLLILHFFKVVQKAISRFLKSSIAAIVVGRPHRDQ